MTSSVAHAAYQTGYDEAYANNTDPDPNAFQNTIDQQRYERGHRDGFFNAMLFAEQQRRKEIPYERPHL